MSLRCISMFCSVVLLTSCSSGGDDAGFTPPLLDGGVLVPSGACLNATQTKFIARFLTDTIPRTCIDVSFREPDGGWQGLFTQTVVGPQGFEVDDARGARCTETIERPDGTLNPTLQPVTALEGTFAWDVVSNGRPYTYAGSGSLAFDGAQYSFSTSSSAVTEACAGP